MPTKTPSIISVTLTIILLLLLGLFAGFMLLVALNGFSERDGLPALGTLVLCGSVGIILSAILAGRLTKSFITKYSWNAILAVLVALTASLVLGSVIYVIGFFFAVIVAQTLFSS